MERRQPQLYTADKSGDLLLKLTTNPDPGYAVKECFFTYNPSRNDLYAILPKWPKEHFTIRNLTPAANTHIEWLENHQTLTWHQQGPDIVIDIPAFDPNTHISGSAYVIRIAATGAFAPRPNVSISTPDGSIHPLVTIEPRENTSFHYTLDGSQPNENSPLYTKPFTVDKIG